MKKITAVVLTKNEEKDIKRCLKSVSFCSEILVVDDNSTDKTVEIARSLGVNVIRRELDADFSAQRNFALEEASGDWVIFIDADEEVTEELKKSIQELQPDFNAYYIKRRDIWWGKVVQFGEIKKVYDIGLIRLIKKGSGKWTGKVHEEFRPTQPVGSLAGYLNHYSHESIKDFLYQVNDFSTLRARELFKLGKEPNLIELLFFPPLKFVYTYFFAMGFLDGAAGFVYSFMMSFHSFLVRAKLYQYKKIDRREQ